jgi:hypothetical protein
VEVDRLSNFESLVTEFGNRAPSHYLPREPELKYYQEILQQKGNIVEARGYIQSKFPLMNFAH